MTWDNAVLAFALIAIAAIVVWLVSGRTPKE